MREDWIEVELGEVCFGSKGKKPPVLESQCTDKVSIPYINIKAFEKGIIDEYTNGEKCNLCEDGDLLMVWDGARAGLSGKARKGAVGSTLMKIEEVKGIAVNEEGAATDADLAASVTISIGGYIAAIEKAIAVANLNLSPIVDGEIIRVPVPALTHERRLEMVKLLGQKIEAGKVMVRNVRSETKHQIESQKGEGGVSEDDIERDLSSLEDKVQQHLDKIETLFTDKEKELLTI